MSINIYLSEFIKDIRVGENNLLKIDINNIKLIQIFIKLIIKYKN